MKKWPSISTLPPSAKHVLSDHQLPCLLSIEQLPLIHLQHCNSCRRSCVWGPMENGWKWEVSESWYPNSCDLVSVQDGVCKFKHPSYSTNSAPVPKMLPVPSGWFNRKKVPMFPLNWLIKGGPISPNHERNHHPGNDLTMFNYIILRAFQERHVPFPSGNHLTSVK